MGQTRLRVLRHEVLKMILAILRFVFCMGLLGFAGLCGLVLAKLEEKVKEEQNGKQAYRHHRE